MTRERREELAHSAKTTMLNDFKEALNKVCINLSSSSYLAFGILGLHQIR